MTDEPEHSTPDGLPHDPRLHELYRALPVDEPRAELDARILEAARGQTRPATGSNVLRIVRWSIPLAAAAGVALTVTLLRVTPVSRDTMMETPARDPGNRSSSDDVRAAEQDRTAPASDALARRAAPAEPSLQSAPLAQSAPSAEATPSMQSAPPAATARARSKADEQQTGARSDSSASAAPRSAGPSSPPVVMETKPAAPSAAASAAARPESFASNDDAYRKQTTPREPEADAKLTPPPAAWPLGLEPGLTASEACRRMRAATSQDCAWKDGSARFDFSPAAVIPGAAFAGKVDWIRLFLTDGKLSSIELRGSQGLIELPPKAD